MLRVILDADNDLPPGGPVLASGSESARTALQAVFGTQQGEWGFDKLFGTPWRPAILRKFFDAAATRAIMANTANTVPDIEPVVGAQVLIDTTSQAAARQVDITIEDVLVDGDVQTLTLSTVL